MPDSATGLTSVDAAANYEATRAAVGYVTRKEAGAEVYAKLGYMCGLEIHQQLLTEKKLFCNCPGGIYQLPGEFDAELVRHMRPTLSELGEYDGTALMEFRTRKNIIYRIANETACTYDIDDTPPFPINREALRIAIKIALMLKCNIVGELHITRKQYLDGSIPTGFQRTAIVGIEGDIPISNKTIRIIQISIEEDSCREISDIGHYRTYSTDRLGMPLIETVTYPDMKTPDEAAEAAQYLRYLARASNEVRTGMGAARQDVNVSVTGGTRVEIKGVAHIKWIPELTHNEAFRQSALLRIRDQLNQRMSEASEWKLSHVRLDEKEMISLASCPGANVGEGRIPVAVNLPGFGGLLSHFTQPEQSFADELSGRLRVVACLDRPNMASSEDRRPLLEPADWTRIASFLGVNSDDAQLVFWAPEDDIPTALLTLEERCQMAFEGVPNETRQALRDGTTVFERVLPGPDRMYPDTDSAPIPVGESEIENIQNDLPTDVSERLKQLSEWRVPRAFHDYLLSSNLVGFIEGIHSDHDFPPVFIARVLAQYLKDQEDTFPGWPKLPRGGLLAIFEQTKTHRLDKDIIPELVAAWYRTPGAEFGALLESIRYAPLGESDISAAVEQARSKFERISRRTAPDAEVHWLMGQVRPLALGNIPLRRLRELVDAAVNHG